jgi:membrane protease YdiL (CAAX protease family)
VSGPVPGSGVTAPAAGPLEFDQLHRAGRGGGWWTFLAVVVAIVGFLTAQLVAIMGFFAYFLIRGDDDLQASVEGLIDTDAFGPLGLLFVLVAIALATPLMIYGFELVSGVPKRFATSVVGRFRVRWFLAMLGVSLLTLVLAIVVGAFLPTSAGDTGTDQAGLNDFTRTTFEFLTIMVILVPFQAAAEEYVFRGLLMQGLGSIRQSELVARVVAIVGSALVFAVFHGLQSPPIFFDRFAFGLVAAYLAIRTGGLEAGIAYHVVNNYLAFGIAILFGDVGEALNPEGGSGWDVLLSTVKSLLLLALTLWAAGAMKVETRVDRTELAPPPARV